MTVFDLFNDSNISDYNRSKGPLYYAKYPNGDIFVSSSNSSRVLFKYEKVLLNTLKKHSHSLWLLYKNKLDTTLTEEEFCKEFLNCMIIKTI